MSAVQVQPMGDLKTLEWKEKKSEMVKLVKIPKIFPELHLTGSSSSA